MHASRGGHAWDMEIVGAGERRRLVQHDERGSPLGCSPRRCSSPSGTFLDRGESLEGVRGGSWLSCPGYFYDDAGVHHQPRALPALDEHDLLHASVRLRRRERAGPPRRPRPAPTRCPSRPRSRPRPRTSRSPSSRGPLLTNLVLNPGAGLRPRGQLQLELGHLRREPVGRVGVRSNSFRTNQFAHPYQGSLYFTAARSLGVGFHTSRGSHHRRLLALGDGWGVEAPAINDLITTAAAGIAVREVLFRLSTLALGDSDDPGFWREAGRQPSRRCMAGTGSSSVIDTAIDVCTGSPGMARRPLPLSRGQPRRTVAPSDANATDLTIAGRFLHGVPGADGLPPPLRSLRCEPCARAERGCARRQGVRVAARAAPVRRPSLRRGHEQRALGVAVRDYISSLQVFRASSSNVSLGTGAGRPRPQLRPAGHHVRGRRIRSGGVSEQVVDERDYHFGLQATGSPS